MVGLSLRSTSRLLVALAATLFASLNMAAEDRFKPNASPTASIPVPAAEESWQVIFLAGQRVGYARVMVTPTERDGITLVRTEAETYLSIKRFGQALNMSTGLYSEETLDGDLRQFSFQMKNPPASSSSTSGTVQGDTLRLVAEINGKKKESTAVWKAGIKSPTYQDRLFRNNPLEPGQKREFEAFFPEMNKAGKVLVAADKAEIVELLGGKSESLLKLSVSNSLIPGVKTLVWVNDKGDSVKSSTSMLGTAMVTYTVSKEEALKDLSVAELDLGVSTLVKTRQIPTPYQTRKAVYRLTIPDEDPAKVIPVGDTQTLKPVSDHSVDLTVVALDLPEKARIDKADEQFLTPTQYLQSDDVGVIAHANTAAAGLTDPAAIAKAMETYVSTKLTKKNFSTALASAGEVARNLEGDCTEHAVLLAAMLRVKKIPSRVAVGLVYVEGPSAFGGHMWSEAYLNGHWIPLDATLGRGGIGATHIKLGDATFADDQGAPLAAFSSLINVIGKLAIEVISVE